MAPLARLAQVYLHQGQLSQARTCVNEILDHLENDPARSGSRVAPEAYRACHPVLSAQGDPHAVSVLSAAHRALLERAARIHQEELQRSFLENVAAHREILAAWGATA